MGIEQDTIEAAKGYVDFDEDALLVVLGKQERAISENSVLAADPTLNPDYDSTVMGPLDDLKSVGKRILSRWNKELYKLVCGSEDNEDRVKLIEALNLGETAAIAAVASLLLAIAPAAVAAPLAALLVKSFLMPAKEELCDAWGEQLQA
jgi:hypothetical protein